MSIKKIAISYKAEMYTLQIQAPSHKQWQRLMMTAKMQQAIYLLQLPIMELSEVIRESLEQNPVIECISEEEWVPEEREDAQELDPEKELTLSEIDIRILKQLAEDCDVNEIDRPQMNDNECDKDKQSYRESLICAEETLFEHLMKQAREAFDSRSDYLHAERIIGSLNSSGILDISIQEIASDSGADISVLEPILNTIKTFTPFGIAAKDLQECFLIQLACKGKNGTLAERVIRFHFNDLVHNNMSVIIKALKCSAEELKETIDHELVHLDFHPGLSYRCQGAEAIIPDIIVAQDEETVRITLNNDFMPTIRVNRTYLKMIDDPNVAEETKLFIREKIASAKWLLRNLYERNSTLERIVAALIQRNKTFFQESSGQVAPLTMQELAGDLDLHESTVARAVSNKFVDCPYGIFPLRFFFSKAFHKKQKEDISSRAIMELIQKWMNEEDKAKPLSDALIEQKLKEQGICCARRTIAKYRSLLGVGNAHQRKRIYRPPDKRKNKRC